MAYQQRQIQLTVDYIVNQLQYASEKETIKTLTKSHKKWMGQELIQIIDPIQRNNPKVIVINQGNKKFDAFFFMLNEANIRFPENTTYVIKRNGTSFETREGERKEIYNKIKLKSKGSTTRIHDLVEELAALSLEHHASDEEHEDIEHDEFSAKAHDYTPLLKYSSRAKKVKWPTKATYIETSGGLLQNQHRI